MHGWILAAIKTVAHIAIPLVALAAGLAAAEFRPRDVLREPGLLGRSLLAELVVVPLIAVLLVKLLGVPLRVAGGLLIIAISVGPVMALKRARASGADESFAIVLNLVLLLLAIPYLPIAAAVLGALCGRDVSIGMGAVAGVVLPTQLLPLVVGLLIARFAPRVAERLIKPVTWLGNGLLAALALVLLVLATATTIGSARGAMSDEAIRAVKDDW